MLQILLVNLTTNPLVSAGGGPGVVRYVTPHKDLHLRLRTDKKVTKVHSQIGSAVEYRAKDGIIEIRLPLLDLYDSLVVEYQS
jgi:hypothetical protein